MLDISWGSMSNDREVRRLYDIMGEVYPGLLIQMFKRYMSEDLVAAMLQDWCFLRECQGMHIREVCAHVDPIGKAACPITPTLREQS